MMMQKQTVQVAVLRVFTNEEGRYGNQLGVVLQGALVAQPERQRMALTLGFSETIFIDDAREGALRIFTPAGELPFAGHPLVGAAWFLARENARVPRTLRTPAGEIEVMQDGDKFWIRGPLKSTPPWWHERVASADEVARMKGPPDPIQDATQFWAWIDETEGIVRARVFASRYGVHEDEACGSASMRLAAALGRDLRIHHGEGSVVFARPGPRGTAYVGGLVTFDRTIELDATPS